LFFRDYEFHQKLKSFIAKKSDMLFETVDRDEEESTTKNDEDGIYILYNCHTVE